MNISKSIAPAFNLMAGMFWSSRRLCNIATFHLGRSGSRLLGDLLMQHPQVVWEGELFSPGRLQGIEARWPLLTNKPINILKLRMLMAGRRCYGFETQPTQVELLNMELEEYTDRLEKLGFDHFIVLERKNHLRRIVSMLVGRRTSRWHQGSGERPALTRVELDVDQLALGRGSDTEARTLVAYLQHEQDSLLALKQSLEGRRLLSLTYEDDLAVNPETGYRRVCEFTGLSQHQATVRFGKTNPFELREILVNFSEVERALGGTLFEWMLYS